MLHKFVHLEEFSREHVQGNNFIQLFQDQVHVLNYNLVILVVHWFVVENYLELYHLERQYVLKVTLMFIPMSVLMLVSSNKIEIQ
jgi:hypothetical protein